MAGEESDLVGVGVGLRADVADLVVDPELETDALRREELDGVALGSVPEREAHEALLQPAVRSGRRAEELLHEARLLRPALRVLVLRVDDVVVEMAAALLLVLRQEGVERRHELVQRGLAAGDVGPRALRERAEGDHGGVK